MSDDTPREPDQSKRDQSTDGASAKRRDAGADGDGSLQPEFGTQFVGPNGPYTLHRRLEPETVSDEVTTSRPPHINGPAWEELIDGFSQRTPNEFRRSFMPPLPIYEYETTPPEPAPQVESVPKRSSGELLDILKTNAPVYLTREVTNPPYPAYGRNIDGGFANSQQAIVAAFEQAAIDLAERGELGPGLSDGVDSLEPGILATCAAILSDGKLLGRLVNATQEDWQPHLRRVLSTGAIKNGPPNQVTEVDSRGAVDTSESLNYGDYGI